MALPNFRRYNGKENIQSYNKKASTAFAVGDAVYLDSNGFLDKAAVSTAAPDIIGVCMELVASTDTDYAVARPIAVDVADKGNNGDWFACAATGTALQTSVGEAHDLYTNGVGVDIGGTTYKQLKVQKFIDATHVLVSFTGAPQTSVS